MKKKAYLANQLSEDEYKAFRIALAKDEVIVTTIMKLIEHRQKSTDLREDLLRETSYPFQRAFLDGRFKELKWITQLLTKGESHD
jgi:hypothetical protein